MNKLTLTIALLITAAFGLLPSSARAEADPRAEAERPGMVGAYVSMGYWNPAQAEATMAELSALGVDTIIDYAFTEPIDDYWVQPFHDYLASAERHGIKVAYCLFPYLEGMEPGSSTFYTSRLLDAVERLKHYPQITAWYVHDEVLPGIKGDGGTEKYSISLEQMGQLYQRIRAVDPTRPQLCVWHQLPEHEVFLRMFNDQHFAEGRQPWMLERLAYEAALSRMLRESCDWVLVDSYPLGAPWKDSHPVDIEHEVASLTARAQQLKGAEQPLYFVFQSFSWSQYSNISHSLAPFPTLAQMRAMLAAVRAEGAEGAVAYSWFDLAGSEAIAANLPGREQCLKDLRTLLAELDSQGWPQLDRPGPALSAQAGEPAE